MTVVLREGDAAPPVIVTSGATSVCFHDESGALVRVVALVPGSGVMMTATAGDADFGQVVESLKIPDKIANPEPK